MARAAPSSFDLVFVDPPFDSALAAPALVAAARFRSSRRAMHRREVERLSEMLAIEQIRIPHLVTTGLTEADIRQLAGTLA